MRAKKNACLIIWISGCSGIWYCQTSPLHRETGEFFAGESMRVGLAISISKESRKKGFGQNKFNVLKLGANPFSHSQNKLPFLLQRLLQA
jgi:hypothetical protein